MFNRPVCSFTGLSRKCSSASSRATAAISKELQTLGRLFKISLTRAEDTTSGCSCYGWGCCNSKGCRLISGRRISENVDLSFFWEWPLVSSVYSEVVFPPAVQLVVLHIYYLTKGITRTPTAGGRATVQITHSLATCRGSLVT